jgi:uncharacterized membrane protein YbaN (DUF454 family)
MGDQEHDTTARPGLVRGLLIAAGGLCTALGLVGAFLPILPTTPFLLLASACFARSSPRFHRRLLASPVFGPYLTQWRRERTIPPEAKRKAYGLVVVTFGLSIHLVDRAGLRVLLALLGLALLAFLAWLPTKPREGGS